MEAASAPEGVDRSVFDPVRDEEDFLKTFQVLRLAAESVSDEVGSKIFGSVDSRGRIKGQFAVYHFEGFSLGLQKILNSLNPNDSAQMKLLGKKALEIKKDPELRNHTGGGKNTVRAYKARVEYFTSKLFEILV
ncbi:hypothetical protein KGD82_25905 [Nocardiopsis eucommiae]|uniref:Uncharacterized protein n=1 Tax=Nocardiopsis eucommiae TaxID=2831970 RepID=A0A975QKL2_9ACTN|nr:hypothetical protein KGD82_25905 [Nocardiopsis eucommiae]